MEFSAISSMNIISAIFVFALFFFALFRISQKFKTHQKKPPPEAGGGWPLIGHLLLLGGKEPAHLVLSKMADSYGPIFTMRLGMRRALVVSSWEIARECFTTNDVVFASRPKLLAPKLLGYDYAMIGFSPYGPYWRHVRRIATLGVLSNHRVDQLQPVRKAEVQSSIKKLYDFCRRNDGGDRAFVEMNSWFENITLNMIFGMVVGKSFASAFEGEGNEEYRKALRDFFEFCGIFVVSDSFPFLEWMDFGGHGKAMKKTARVLDQVFDKWLREHKEERRNSGDLKTERDLMDVMLSIVENGEEFPGYDADTVTKSTCLVMILAASDTTAVTMIWALSLLLNNKEALKKAQLELDQQIGRERLVEESDVKNLPYLQAIVKETLRLYPAGPLSIPHESTDDCTVAGYHVAAGTRLIVNLQKLQRDPHVWERACEFVPERFLSTHKDFDVRGQNFQLIPFGSGRRMCPGISFALPLMHLTLANVVHGFEIETPFGEDVDMEESIGLTSIKISPLKVVLTPRLHPHVYK